MPLFLFRSDTYYILVLLVTLHLIFLLKFVAFGLLAVVPAIDERIKCRLQGKKSIVW